MFSFLLKQQQLMYFTLTGKIYIVDNSSWEIVTYVREDSGASVLLLRFYTLDTGP